MTEHRLADEAAHAASVRREELQRAAAEAERLGANKGVVTFEYSVRETTQEAVYLDGYTPHPGEPAPPHFMSGHRMVIREKGSREELPRHVALRKQRQGLGYIVGEFSPPSEDPGLLTVQQL